MKCLILAAGYATRLYPLTKDRPKPLLDVAHKKIIDWIMEKVDPVREVDHIYVVTNNKFLDQFSGWAKDSEYDTPITVISDGTQSEDDRLGALGDISFGIEKLRIKDDLMIIAGDNLFEFDLSRLIDCFSKQRSHILAARDIGSIDLARRLGVLSVDEHGQVVDFEEKPDQPKSTLVATLMYIFPKEKLSMISQYLQSKGANDRAGDYLAWLHKVERLDALVFDEPWFDIGSFDQLDEANRFYFGKRAASLPKTSLRNV